MLKLPFHYEVVSRSDLSSPAFLALNPLGQIPVLKDGNLILPDSNAILVYLATEYDDARVWYPVNPVTAAHIQRWLSLAAGEVRFGPAMARAIRLQVRPGDLEAAQKIAKRLLMFMDAHLTDRSFLANDAALERIEALPAFTPMPSSPQPA
jgi:glutathione S-transferase